MGGWGGLGFWVVVGGYHMSPRPNSLHHRAQLQGTLGGSGVPLPTQQHLGRRIRTCVANGATGEIEARALQKQDTASNLHHAKWSGPLTSPHPNPLNSTPPHWVPTPHASYTRCTVYLHIYVGNRVGDGAADQDGITSKAINDSTI